MRRSAILFFLLSALGMGVETPRIEVGSTFCGKMTRHVRASYPAKARTARVQGMVRVQAVISKTGVPEKLEVLRGDPLLVPAALAAIRQWRYAPCLLHSEPVEVIAQLEVNFSLNQ